MASYDIPRGYPALQLTSRTHYRSLREEASPSTAVTSARPFLSPEVDALLEQISGESERPVAAPVPETQAAKARQSVDGGSVDFNEL